MFLPDRKIPFQTEVQKFREQPELPDILTANVCVVSLKLMRIRIQIVEFFFSTTLDRPAGKGLTTEKEAVSSGQEGYIS